MAKKCCEFCEENQGLKVKAVKRVPQSGDEGKTIEFFNVCQFHADTWWDGADWDGRHLEQKLS